jgi:hypothetical protein
MSSAACSGGAGWRRCISQRTQTPAALLSDLMGKDAPHRRYSEGDVRAIVQRASEMEAVQPTAGGSLTIGGIEALAGEVGIAPSLVRAAATELGAAPRELTGTVRERFQRLAYSPWQMMEPNKPPDEPWGVGDVLALVFFSIVTAGVLPLVFIGHARTRRRRLRAFFRDGLPASAEVLDFREESLGFDVKVSRVRYEFTADGRVQRGSDLVLPVIADRWRAGDRIEILYLPQRNYDSVIVTA